jgi:hypothetical protein
MRQLLQRIDLEQHLLEAQEKVTFLDWKLRVMNVAVMCGMWPLGLLLLSSQIWDLEIRFLSDYCERSDSSLSFLLAK